VLQETPISFDSSDYPKNMAGVGQLLLLLSPTITNIKLYHILVDGGAALNLICLMTFKRLQILMSKLQRSHPFSRMGPVLVMPCGCISLPVTFGMPENFRIESVLFDIAEVPGPEDAIPQWCPQDPQRPQCRCLCTQEAPGFGLTARGYNQAWGSRPGIFKLAPPRQIISTPRATL
jgi:hypothetical protein